MGLSQATTISQVLGKLPDDLGTSQVEQSEDLMIEFADQFDSAGLAQLSRHLVEVADPVGVEEREAKRLEQDLKRAKAARHLNFLSDGNGSTLIRSSLQTLDAAPLVKLLGLTLRTPNVPGWIGWIHSRKPCRRRCEGPRGFALWRQPTNKDS